MPTEPKEPRQTNSFLQYSGFAIQLFAGIGIAGWLGHRLDLYLTIGFPAFMLTFSLAVLAGMLYQMNKNLNKE